MAEGQPIDYQSSGVDYSKMDPFKRQAQALAATTATHLESRGMREVGLSRGESAYVWERGDEYMTMVVEGLGTKNIVADAMRTADDIATKEVTHYDAIAQDTFAMIVNDLVTVGGIPEVVSQYVAVGDSNWFNDEKRAIDFLEGWKRACDTARVTWGGGETPTLSGIILPGAVDLAGAAVGSIRPKDRLILGQNLKPGDVMIGVQSSGIHANGLTLARRIASGLTDGYQTRLSDGRTFGEALLSPTVLYSPLIEGIQNDGIAINYVSNITGHGYRKVMRSPSELTYRIHDIPTAQPEFGVIQDGAKVDDSEMYGNYNMGLGYVMYVNEEVAMDALETTKGLGFKAMIIGQVEDGPKQVIIEPKNIAFAGDTLGVR